MGAPSGVESLKINGKSVKTATTKAGALLTTVEYNAPSPNIPDLKTADWKYTNGLPEAYNDYDDFKRRAADNTKTNDNFVVQLTPTALYGREYGLHSGYLISLRHFQSS